MQVPPGSPRDPTWPPPQNPFERLSPRVLAAIYDWPLEARRFLTGEVQCLHAVGDCGMGKTTLLEQAELALRQRGERSHLVCVSPAGEADYGPPDEVLLLDEMDRLPRRELRRLLRLLRGARRRAVLAGHRWEARAIERAGLQAECLRLAPLATPDAVTRLFANRLKASLGEEAEQFPVTSEAKAALLRCSGGNIERCLQLGYEVFEDLAEPRPLSAEDFEAAARRLARALTVGEASR
jgi:hypothetical protein